MVARFVVTCFSRLAFTQFGAHVGDEICACDFGLGVCGAVADFKGRGSFVLDHHYPRMRGVALFAKNIVDGTGVGGQFSAEVVGPQASEDFDTNRAEDGRIARGYQDVAAFGVPCRTE